MQRSGDVRWSFDAGGEISGAPTVLDGVVYFSTLEEKTFGLDAETGKKLWEFDDGKYSPVVADKERVYLAGYKRLYGLTPSGGEIDDLVGRYMVDVDNFRTEEKERLLEQIEEMTVRRFRVAEHLLETRPWDLFFMVEMGTDRIHHAFWRFFDHEHRLYESGNPYEQAVLDYYKALDEKVGRLLRFAGEDTTVLVVSDHGAKKMDGGICVNEWLRREGYLVLRDEPAEPGPLKPEMIDWERTTAWGEGGSRR